MINHGQPIDRPNQATDSLAQFSTSEALNMGLGRGTHESAALQLRESLKANFREKLTVLVSSVPGHFLRIHENPSGDIPFESSFGGVGIGNAEGNKSIDAILSLLSAGETRPIHFNQISAKAVASQASFAKTDVEDIATSPINDHRPVVYVRGRLPADAVEQGPVTGSSPFLKNMSKTSQLGLEYIESIALDAPNSVLERDVPPLRDIKCAKGYLELLDKLAEHGIEASESSPGKILELQLRQKLAAIE